VSRVWGTAFRVNYAVIGRLDPLITRWWRRFGIGNVVELHVPGRSTGLERRVLLGLLRAGDAQYLGHPNGDAQWTRNLAAARGGGVVWRDGSRRDVTATPVAPGPEREAVIRSTGQHPFPGNLLYFLGRAHIRDVGVFFRLEPAGEPAARAATAAATGPRERV
jgi:hypothetical protein